jgi:SulP family sulfate permease
MPALGAILIVAGIRGIKVRDVEAVFETGWASWIVAVTTFLATLLAPIQAAVGLGVVLSALIYIIRSASDISVVELVRREDGLIEERKPCKELPSNDVTVLDLYGPVFFATARSLEHLLPSPRGSQNAAVVLRLRGQSDLGATLMEVLSSYARKLKAAGGRLYLSGLNKGALVRLAESDKLNVHGPVQGYEVTSILGQSTRQAIADAEAWLVEKVKGKPSKE